MAPSVVLAASALAASAPLVSTSAAQAPAQPATWSDEFDGTALDTTRWSYRATGARHDGILTPDAVSVAGGALRIVTYTRSGTHYSGMISTQEHDAGGFEQTYGYFEARVKFVNTSGQWSAFWLQSPTIGNPIGDPETAGVEMDVAEHRATCPSPPGTCAASAGVAQRIQQAMIWDGYAPGTSKAAVNFSDALTGLGNGSWHTWAVRWTPTGVTFYYDDAETWSQTGPVSRRSQYIILSSEVGAFFAGAIPVAGYGTREESTTDTQVDYVRVWALAPVNRTAPAVTGTPAVGELLACATGTWASDDAPAFARQWLRDGSAIAGATGPDYSVGAADPGHALACRVTATTAAGSTTTTSNALTIPAPLQGSTPPDITPLPPDITPLPPAPLVPLAPLVPPPTPVDRSAPAATLSGATRQRFGRTVAVTIACPDEACRTTTAATVRVPRLGRTRARTYRAVATTMALARGGRATVRLRLSRTARRAIGRALRARQRIVVVLSVRAADSAGNSRKLTRRVTLLR